MQASGLTASNFVDAASRLLIPCIRMELVWLSAHVLAATLVVDPVVTSPEAPEPPVEAPAAPEAPAAKVAEVAASPSSESSESSPSPPADVAPAEVVRVKRDFGKPNFDLVIDAWADVEAAHLREIRLWWTNTDEVDHRKPLGRMIERMVKLQYRRLSDTALTVAVAGDGKRFTFTVELNKDGKVVAYVPIETEDGRHIRRCRTDSARLLARRVLGMPVGISYIAVSCRDGRGVLQQGKLRYREI